MKTVLRTLAVAGAFALATQANAINIPIANNSFENPIVGGNFNTVSAVDNTSITSWTVSAGSVDHIGNYWTAQDGAQSIDMSGTSAGTLSQSIFVPVNGFLTVDFWMSGNPDGGIGNIVDLEVGLVGVQNFSYTVTGTANNMNWVQQTASFGLVASGNYTLEFRSLEANPFGAALDNVSADVREQAQTNGVPDGGTSVVLFGMSLLAIGAGRKLTK